MKDFNQKGNISLVILAIAVLVIGVLVYLKSTAIQPLQNLPSPNILPKSGQFDKTGTEESNQSETHSSKDLKISFHYPKGWYVDEKDRDILITSYSTHIGENKQPLKDQIRISIDEASLCQDSIDKDLIYGGCGENQKILNKITNKETDRLPSGIFNKYTVEYPDNSQRIIYYLQSPKNILQISKQPDPSQFEIEFEGIINSIEFI